MGARNGRGGEDRSQVVATGTRVMATVHFLANLERTSHSLSASCSSGLKRHRRRNTLVGVRTGPGAQLEEQSKWSTSCPCWRKPSLRRRPLPRAGYCVGTTAEPAARRSPSSDRSAGMVNLRPKRAFHNMDLSKGQGPISGSSRFAAPGGI